MTKLVLEEERDIEAVNRIAAIHGIDIVASDSEGILWPYFFKPPHQLAGYAGELHGTLDIELAENNTLAVVLKGIVERYE